MTMQFTEWKQNPVRAVFMDETGHNMIVSSEDAVKTRAASAEYGEYSFTQPQVSEARKAIAALNAKPALKTP
ncbi:MAG: hypothetical protein DI626_11540 [Micavibrio aeruginosavorus]|uniref:Uncharacterized protein n=1 Tax=Micavibrio aeruginosavorus TaxID=349221 RepID=A0A2W4ZBI7_9BACT|nr:MAG: hypothetical protein DI626_11540 [Micavibrio aeruginosavorus]